MIVVPLFVLLLFLGAFLIIGIAGLMANWFHKKDEGEE